MKRLLLFLLILSSVPVLAQPANDDCSDAIVLSDIDNWCSETAAYTNAGASQSSEGKPDCFADVGSDIWFRFDAVGTSLNIRILGDIVDIYGISAFSQGTLERPRLALYKGECGELELVSCNQDDGDHIAEIYSEEIVPSATYYLRVSSSTADAGTFQLCVSSYNFVPNPNSDCGEGVVLCDKSSFFVASIQGAGRLDDEISTSCLTAEDNSAWYKWVAGSNGSLSFTITPNNPGDDIDFVVYELPNGINNCDDKVEIRCMASGANGDITFGGFNPAPFDEWDECTGPTGLRSGDSDLNELAGCQQGNDNFASAFNMEEGKAYALVVLNFSATGHGFSIDFGGTGEFLGPDADFITDDPDGTVCFGDPVTIFDQSSFGNLSLVNWQWNFGDGASPQTRTGPGPHRISYSTGGFKSIALTVESETGCLVTSIGSIIVEDPIRFLPTIVPQTCPDIETGSISLDIESSSDITSIIWEDGTTGPLLTNLAAGEYAVQVQNFNGCDTTATFMVDGPQPLQIDTIIATPSCGGTADGSIQINVQGQAPPYLFNFNLGAGFTPDNAVNGLSSDVYNVSIQDINGCITDLVIPLGEIDINVSANPTVSPTCAGFQDGSIDLQIIGGVPPFEFDWNLDDNFIPSHILNNVGAGRVIVAIRDNMGCQGFVDIDVEEPPELIVSADTTDISCFGEQDGSLVSRVSGGTGDYAFQWSHGSTDSVAQNLAKGTYTLTVTDDNGCQTRASGDILEPPELFLRLDSLEDVLCYGEATGALYFTGYGGSGPYSYSIDGETFTSDSSILNIGAGGYDLTVMDIRGCTLSIPVEINQPEQMIVDAGPDTTIDLGFTANLAATHSPAGKPVVYSWRPVDSLACDNCPSLVVRPPQTQTYTVTIVDADGCMVSDAVTVQVYSNKPIFIPNAITPNGDGLNDRLAVFGGPAARSVDRIQIFDRWGERVFEGRDLALNDDSWGWDGTHHGVQLNPGVFVYVAEVSFIDDTVLVLKGDITLIR